MNKDHYPFYGVALGAAGALVVWAGMPVAFLLFLVCPLMMILMMKGMGMGMGMGGMHGNAPVEPKAADSVTVPVEDPKRL